VPADIDIDAIWSDTPQPIQGPAQPYLFTEQYSKDIQMLASVVKALYYGATRMEMATPRFTANEYYQGMIGVLIHEGVDPARIAQAIELIVMVERRQLND
jgi:hypothetical protein